jgi:hypothetical protein
MTTYIIVEGHTDQTIIRPLLPPDLVDSSEIVVARGTPVSVARTLLVTKLKPVALLLDTDTRNEMLIAERRQNATDVIKLVSAKIPVKVVLFVPMIESIFFAAPKLLEKIYGTAVTKELMLIAQDHPKKALSQLFQSSSGPQKLEELLACLDDEDREALRGTQPLRELIEFLVEVKNRSLQKVTG